MRLLVGLARVIMVKNWGILIVKHGYRCQRVIQICALTTIYEFNCFGFDKTGEKKERLRQRNEFPLPIHLTSQKN